MSDTACAPPLLVCLHFLGGSAQSWREVAGKLSGHVRCLPLDLPGFGEEPAVTGYNVKGMADCIATTIGKKVTGDWMIAGHSMGAKVAGVLARRAEDGAAALAGLRGVILLAGSPPSPEPMQEAKRSEMLGWFTGDRTTWQAHATDYIEKNVASSLDSAIKKRAVRDMLRMQPDAWIAWLQNGSREDWAERIGVLRTPALILAGAEDSALGEDAQRRLTAPHFASHRLVTLKGAGHLLPMERPGEVATLIANHIETVCAAA